MCIVKYSELVHMTELHSQARAFSPYERVPNILRYTFNNLYLQIVKIQREHMDNRVRSYFPKGGHSATETELKII